MTYFGRVRDDVTGKVICDWRGENCDVTPLMVKAWTLHKRRCGTAFGTTIEFWFCTDDVCVEVLPACDTDGLKIANELARDRARMRMVEAMV